MKKIIGMFTVVLTICSLILSAFVMKPIEASADSWRTGCFDSGYTAQGYTTVHLSNPNKKAYIKIYTYDMWGNKSSGQMHITFRTTSGKWLCEFDTKSGRKLKLGNDNSAYRIYIAKKSYPDTIKGRGDNFINVGKCTYWGINCVSNCYI